MLVEIAIGDAYGASFEFAPRDYVERLNTGDAYYPNPAFPLIGNGNYTDDTQMSIAVYETVRSRVMTPEAFARAFFDAFKRDPRPGYSRHFTKVLYEAQSVEDMLAGIKSGSTGSGAAMRSIPLGLLDTPEEVIEIATLQAKITHDSEIGIKSSLAIALASHYLRTGQPLCNLGKYLVKHVGAIDWRSPWTGEVPNGGIEVAHAAITALRASASLKDVLRTAVAFTGDVDSVAALALGLASLGGIHKRDLPVALHDGLENGPYGRDTLLRMDREQSIIDAFFASPVDPNWPSTPLQARMQSSEKP